MKSLDNSNGVQYYGGNDPAKMGGRFKKGGGGSGGKSLMEKSDQAYKLFEQAKNKISQLKDKLSSLGDEGAKLQNSLTDAMSKVESGRVKKSSSTQKDMGKFAASLSSELANNGKQAPIMRQKGNKKQIAELHNKINENYNERLSINSQIKRQTTRANNLFNTSQDYLNKASR